MNRCRRRCRRGHRAFTLIEMIVVIVLIGLLSAAVVMSFARPVQKVRARDAVEMVRALDESMRAQARRSGQTAQIVIDLSARTLARRDGAGNVVFEAALPTGIEIDRFRNADEDLSSAHAVVSCSPLGLTRTYAVHLSGPGLDQWLLFAGLSGDAMVIKDEATLDSIFLAQSRGNDAH
jgi:prepilin-type N-terminal cleavage/methylation domain-containing protein